MRTLVLLEVEEIPIEYVGLILLILFGIVVALEIDLYRK